MTDNNNQQWGTFQRKFRSLWFRKSSKKSQLGSTASTLEESRVKSLSSPSLNVDWNPRNNVIPQASSSYMFMNELMDSDFCPEGCDCNQVCPCCLEAEQQEAAAAAATLASVNAVNREVNHDSSHGITSLESGNPRTTPAQVSSSLFTDSASSPPVSQVITSVATVDSSAKMQRNFTTNFTEKVVSCKQGINESSQTLPRNFTPHSLQEQQASPVALSSSVQQSSSRPESLFTQQQYNSQTISQTNPQEAENARQNAEASSQLLVMTATHDHQESRNPINGITISSNESNTQLSTTIDDQYVFVVSDLKGTPTQPLTVRTLQEDNTANGSLSSNSKSTPDTFSQEDHGVGSSSLPSSESPSSSHDVINMSLSKNILASRLREDISLTPGSLRLMFKRDENPYRSGGVKQYRRNPIPNPVLQVTKAREVRIEKYKALLMLSDGSGDTDFFFSDSSKIASLIRDGSIARRAILRLTDYESTPGSSRKARFATVSKIEVIKVADDVDVIIGRTNIQRNPMSVVKSTLFDDLVDESAADLDDQRRKKSKKSKAFHDKDDRMSHQSFCRECEVKKMQDDLAVLTSIRCQRYDEYATVNKPKHNTLQYLSKQESNNRTRVYESLQSLPMSVSQPEVKKMQDEIMSLKQEVESLKKKLNQMEIVKKSKK